MNHSEGGGQYLSIRYSERLAEAGAVASIGSQGDSYDNALAATTIGLVKKRRLHGEIGLSPPVEHEAAY